MSSPSYFSIFGVFAIAFLFFSSPVLSKDEEDNLLQGLNSYRQAQNLPPLAKNAKADCIAEEIADDNKDQPCAVTTAKSNVVPSRPSQITKFMDYAEKCKVDINTTTDAIVMPVCVPKLVQTLLLANYTHSQYAKYLNDSRFVGAGVGSEDDWMVVVLTTGASGGSFEGSGTESLMASVWGCVALALLGLMIGNFVRL
ncbi:uncharacterized GPI-anchored protein At3g06035 [Cucurbita pepo subsp. pepo]|uniref:Uncharacterized GPI-anchored protein At3g06035 n=1 Tax=Cucurbita moschata TaxID=3662 RepID=A0A6J1G4I7_CUCMO|nr:uncharacterized GPI-anchored protein At3g06035 [Cucurbita moschata]XP_023545378.1 uncharacterized GPI-anchored protein At3g06035 [Cucurbita pepo subsp. pepo]